MKYSPKSRNLKRHFTSLSSDDAKDVLYRVIAAHHVLVDVLHLPVHESLKQVNRLFCSVKRIVTGVKNYHSKVDALKLKSHGSVLLRVEKLTW